MTHAELLEALHEARSGYAAALAAIDQTIAAVQPLAVTIAATAGAPDIPAGQLFPQPHGDPA